MRAPAARFAPGLGRVATTRPTRRRELVVRETLPSLQWAFASRRLACRRVLPRNFGTTQRTVAAGVTASGVTVGGVVEPDGALGVCSVAGAGCSAGGSGRLTERSSRAGTPM